MFFTYVLLSLKDKKFYIGYTDNLKERLKKHQTGKVLATKPRLPVKLIYAELHLNKYDALRREKYFKTSKGKNSLYKMCREYLKSVGINKIN